MYFKSFLSVVVLAVDSLFSLAFAEHHNQRIVWLCQQSTTAAIDDASRLAATIGCVLVHFITN